MAELGDDMVGLWVLERVTMPQNMRVVALREHSQNGGLVQERLFRSLSNLRRSAQLLLHNFHRKYAVRVRISHSKHLTERTTAKALLRPVVLLSTPRDIIEGLAVDRASQEAEGSDAR